MSALPQPLPVHPRKPPVAAQMNWVTDRDDYPPEQLQLPLEPLEEEMIKDDHVTLLATESGSQMLVSGFGLLVGKKGERVVVRRGKMIQAQVPMMRLQELIVEPHGLSLTMDLVEELCNRGIRIGCVRRSGHPFALLTSPFLTATVETRKAQLRATENATGAEIARWMVAGKIRNQEKLLRYFGKSRPDERRVSLEAAAVCLRRLRKDVLQLACVHPEEQRMALMGLEGTAGRMYWQQIQHLVPEHTGFTGRRHQGAPDVVNAALNYGYGILQTHVWGAVMNAGLEPFAGFLHVDRSGKPSLVLDLMEEFRQPVVDRAVLSWVNKGGQLRMERGLLDGASREEVAARVLARMNSTEPHGGRKHEIRSIIQQQARLTASAVRGQRAYRPFSFRW